MRNLDAQPGCATWMRKPMRPSRNVYAQSRGRVEAAGNEAHARNSVVEQCD
jgi:hypothetical protein